MMRLIIVHETHMHQLTKGNLQVSIATYDNSIKEKVCACLRTKVKLSRL